MITLDFMVFDKKGELSLFSVEMDYCIQCCRLLIRIISRIISCESTSNV